jgi:hypothetical protein
MYPPGASRRHHEASPFAKPMMKMAPSDQMTSNDPSGKWRCEVYPIV